MDETIPARPGSRTPVVIPTGYDENDLIEQRPAKQVTVNKFVADKEQEKVRPAKRLPPGQAAMDSEEEQVGSVPSGSPERQESPSVHDLSPEQIAIAVQMLQQGVIPVGPQSLNPVAQQREAPAPAPAPPEKPKVRIVYQLPGGHNIRLAVREVLVEPDVLVVVSDAESAGMAVTPALGRMGLQYEGTVHSVLYAGAEFEYNGDLFQVFQRVPDDE